MKKLIGTLGVIVAVCVLYSCSDDATEELAGGNNDGTTAVQPGSSQLAVEDASTSATVDAVYEDIDDIADVNFAETSGARTGGGKHSFGDCVEVTKEGDTKTIDFGDGCEGKRGVVRSGKIIITKSGTRGEVGFMRVVTFEDFFVDSIKVEGTRTIEITAVDGSVTTLSITLEDGELKFPDDTKIEREANRTKIITRDEEGKVSMTEKYGTASGENRDGLEYTATVESSDPITHLRACRADKIYAPVSGVRTISVEGEEDKVIDFGDGECDNLATVTQGGESEEIEVDPRRKKRRFRRAK